MRLLGKRLLLLITDGVDMEEYRMLRIGFEAEHALLYVTAPGPYLTVETVEGDRRGPDITVDVPFEAVAGMAFDGLVIPDGIAATDTLCQNPRVLELVFSFYQESKPIFASGVAVQLLYESHVLSQQVVVREGTPMVTFLDRAVEVLLDRPLLRAGQRLAYRPTM